MTPKPRTVSAGSAAAAEAAEEACDTLRETLRDLDVDALSPREALDLLYTLKREADT